MSAGAPESPGGASITATGAPGDRAMRRIPGLIVSAILTSAAGTQQADAQQTDDWYPFAAIKRP